MTSDIQLHQQQQQRGPELNNRIFWVPKLVISVPVSVGLRRRGVVVASLV